MNNLNEISNDEGDFLFEDVDRYKLSITIDSKTSYTTSNDLDYLKVHYDNIVAENLNTEREVIVGIYDYDKNTYIYSYNSEYDR